MLKRRTKELVLRTAQASGVSSLAAGSAWRRRRLLILSYHGTSIDDEHRWRPSLYLEPAAMKRRAQLIQRPGCTVLRLDDAVQRLYRGDLPPRSVVLTVDDGTYDFYREAYPIFAGFGFPVTVYLTTYYVDYNRPVFDPMVSYLLWKGRGRKLRWPEALGSNEPALLTGPGIENARAAIQERACQRKLSGAEKDSWLSNLAERLNLDYAGILRRRILHLMLPEEVRELSARGVDFELHTHRHGVSEDKDVFAGEIRDNRERLGRMHPVPAKHFCYPNGVHSRRFPPWLKEWGIVSATTCEHGLASPECDPLLLPRFLDSSNVSEAEFTGWLTGVSAWLPAAPAAASGRLLEPGGTVRYGSAAGV